MHVNVRKEKIIYLFMLALVWPIQDFAKNRSRTSWGMFLTMKYIEVVPIGASVVYRVTEWPTTLTVRKFHTLNSIKRSTTIDINRKVAIIWLVDPS